MMELLTHYYGRLMTKEQVPETIKPFAKTLPAMTQKGSTFICNRCGCSVSIQNKLPDDSVYCRNCLVFGRLSSRDKLYYFEQLPFPKKGSLIWQGQLTPFQKEVSDALKVSIQHKENTLVHAVTGAGKTEMIYETLDTVLTQGGALALASPRVDVCLELYKRLRRDFSCSISLLHGESEDYKRSPLIIATTHQLLKFYQAFDLLIIDEVDAFPFVDNPMLYHAVDQCLKTNGVKVFLTATSTDQLDKQVKKGKLKELHLARRFHANPLVVPQLVWLSFLAEKLQRDRLPKHFLTYLNKQRHSQFPLLIFFPNIELGQRFAQTLQKILRNEKVDFVSSLTSERLEKVENFRKGYTHILVSTTILERGVTFPCVDVFVMMANHHLFTKSSLVQIAGRVGRSIDRPTGQVIFFHDGLNKAIKKAVLEIKNMNHKGGFR